MSVWGLEFRIAIALFVVLIPLALWPLVYFHYRRHGRFAGVPALVTGATFLYVCGLIAFTMFPLPETTDDFCTLRENVSFWQLQPFSFVGDLVRVIEAEGLVGLATSATLWQVLFNIVLFVPLGFVLVYRYRRGLASVLGIGLLVSLFIELTQGTALWGAAGCPYRLADVDDLILNTTGAACGWLLAKATIRFLPDPDPPPVADTSVPLVGRRVAAGGLDLLVWGLTVLLLIVLEALIFGGERTTGEFIDHWLVVLTSVVVGSMIWLIVPLIRRDRATPGQIAVWLAQTTPPSQRMPPGRSAIRFALRWLVFLAIAAWSPIAAAAIVFAYELAGVFIDRKRRSVSGSAAGVTVVTRRSLETTKSGADDS
ncbi:MAG: VanZ family protein [Acidimicrobiia bacterium]